MLTPKSKAALRFLKRNGETTPRRFAEFMWPDSPCWHKMYRCGNGSTRGAGMWLAGGSFLGKLKRQRLVNRSFRKSGEGVYHISPKGLEQLIEHDGEMFTE